MGFAMLAMSWLESNGRDPWQFLFTAILQGPVSFFEVPSTSSKLPATSFCMGVGGPLCPLQGSMQGPRHT